MTLNDLLRCTPASAVPGAVFRRLITKHADLGLKALTPAERVLWVVFELCGELSNGGLHQYFANSSGNACQLVPRALERLGRRGEAKLLRAANALFPEAVQPDRARRVVVLGQLSATQVATLERVERALDDATGALLEALGTWVRAQRADITFANGGLAGFRPVELPVDLRLSEVFAANPESALPALYVRTRRVRHLPARQLSAALELIGEVSEAGAQVYWTSPLSARLPLAQGALRASKAKVALSALAPLLRLPPLGSVRARAAQLQELRQSQQRRLAAVQWTLDEVRGPTLAALLDFARHHADAFAARFHPELLSSERA